MTRLFLVTIDVKDVKNLYQDSEILKRLAVRFKGKTGETFYWRVPAWKDVAEMFQRAHDVEVCNEGGDEGLFIKAAFEVIGHELERCRLQADYEATLEEMARKIDLAANMNLGKPVKWDEIDLK